MTGPACPVCGRADQVRPIVFGEPGPELEELARRGEVILGGCVVPPPGVDMSRPVWGCLRCKRRFQVEA